MKEALVVLPGVTADRAKRSAAAAYFRRHTPYDVYVPRLWQRLGLSFCARQLQGFLRRRIAPCGYDQVHFLCYISGGYILRRAASKGCAIPWGRVVFVRSPIQEQVPFQLVARRGRVLTCLTAGKMVVDLADRARDRLPYPETGRAQGFVLERGLSRLAARLGLRAEDFDSLRAAGEFAVPGGSEALLVEESHDEVYTSERVLGQVAGFLETGTFKTEG